MTGRGWIGAARDALTLPAVAAALGMQGGSRSGWGPCPACGAERRSGSDRRRLPVGSGKPGLWRCFACDAGGDALDMVALALCRRRLSECDPGGRDLVRDWYAARGACDPTPTPDGRPRAVPRVELPPPPEPEPERDYPPAEEVVTLWDACRRVGTTVFPAHALDLDGADFLRRRELPPMALRALDVARWLPLPDSGYPWPSWWPGATWGPWRLAVLGYDPATGQARSLHARRVDPAGGSPKNRWPRGCRAGGLVFADPVGLAMLRGEAAPEVVLVAEGLTDFLAFAVAAACRERRPAVLGGDGGGWAALDRVGWPRGCRVILSADPDDAGDRYVRKARAALREARPDLDVRRLRQPSPEPADSGVSHG